MKEPSIIIKNNWNLKQNVEWRITDEKNLIHLSSKFWEKFMIRQHYMILMNPGIILLNYNKR
jgi:hypothetical protein